MVHCHAGSLEMRGIGLLPLQTVHCHAGSLENNRALNTPVAKVHCHAGSLEMTSKYRAYKRAFTAIQAA